MKDMLTWRDQKNDTFWSLTGRRKRCKMERLSCGEGLAPTRRIEMEIRLDFRRSFVSGLRSSPKRGREEERTPFPNSGW